MKYNFIKENDISTIFIANRDGRIFNVLLDTKNLKRVIDFKYKWHAAWHDHDEYYITATIYNGLISGKASHETMFIQRFILRRHDENL